MTAITVDRLTHRSFFRYPWVSLASVVSLVLFSPFLIAQQVEPVPAPGTAQDLPAGSDADHKRLMQVRAQAQQARREAQLASLQRSATAGTDQSNRDQVLEKARQDKEFKRRAALAVEQQQAVNAYQKVKQSEIDSWNGKGGGKIKPGVPAEFTASLPPLEEDSGERQGLLSGVVNAPGKALKGLSSLRPSFLGGKKKDEAPAPAAQFAPPETLALDAVAPQRSEPSAEAGGEPAAPSEEKGFRIPLVSKLTGGKKKDGDPYFEEGDSGASQRQDSDPPEADSPPEEHRGFFKGIAAAIPLVGNRKEGGGDNPYYYEATDEATNMDDESTSGFLSKLSLKKDKGAGDSAVDEDRDSAEKKGIYIVDSDEAQFFPFGKSGRQASSQALANGTIVRMTKSGDDWSSVELPSGSMGVIRNHSLRRAKADEIPPNLFAHKAKVPFPTTARITKARSATGESSPHRYREPVNVPLPDLPAGGGGTGMPIGNGLLPPLVDEGAIQ
jgi:hypothetical protein